MDLTNCKQLNPASVWASVSFDAASDENVFFLLCERINMNTVEIADPLVLFLLPYFHNKQTGNNQRDSLVVT